MATIVQKFGGTSVGQRAARAAALRHIAAARAAGHRVVVVVSAPGRLGDRYATDTLLRLAANAVAEGAGDAAVAGAAAAGESTPDRAPDPREIDLLLSCGEVISATLFATYLRGAGLPAWALTGAQAGIATDGCHGEAAVLTIDARPLRLCLDAGRVPVVAGFQGYAPGGEVATLGRGGSDTTAAALGVAIGADVVEIYTDVPGLFTADPRRDPGARLLRRVTYRRALEMARAGAKVIHPRAVELAGRYGIPLRILATGGDDPGTLISGRRLPPVGRDLPHDSQELARPGD